MGPAARAAFAARRASSAFASAPPSRVLLRTVAPPPAGLLLRDRAHRALTDRALWILRAARCLVGRIRDPIDFSSLLGQEDYARALDARYARLSAQWLTPVEIFQPHYARAVAAHILRAHRDSHPDQPLAYELGGGTGTCAANFLAHVRDAAPDVYAHVLRLRRGLPASSSTRSDALFERWFETIRNVSTRPRLPPNQKRPPDHRTECTEWRCATRRIARDGARWTARRVSSSRWRCSITFRTIASRGGGTPRGDANPLAAATPPARLSKSSNPSPIR